jgi:hypothetical protein
MADDLTAFVRARLDEDEATANDGRYVRPTDFEVTLNPARVLREVTFRRSLLAACVAFRRNADEQRDSLGQVSSGVWAVTRELRRQVEALAAIWNDHPDYRQGWAP